MRSALRLLEEHVQQASPTKGLPAGQSQEVMRFHVALELQELGKSLESSKFQRQLPDSVRDESFSYLYEDDVELELDTHLRFAPGRLARILNDE